MGSGDIDNQAILELNFKANNNLANKISGTGTLEKTGSHIAALTTQGSNIAKVEVKNGTLALAQQGLFKAGSFDLESGATTVIGPESRLEATGGYAQAAGSTWK